MNKTKSPFYWPMIMLVIGLVVPSIIYLVLTNKYDYCGINEQNLILEKLYFSVVTFSTLGYGDISPLGWVKFVASLQALSGPVTVGFFIYGYGKYIQINEQTKQEEKNKLAEKYQNMDNFDHMQFYRGDVYGAYSHLFSAFKLEYTSVFKQWNVCFLHSKSQAMNSIVSHYYEYGRVGDLIAMRLDQMKEEYVVSKSTRSVFRAQILIDYHIASLESLILRGNQYLGIDKELVKNISAGIRNGNALQARARIIGDHDEHGEPVDELVASYFDSLGGYLEHVLFSMKSLTIAPSVGIASEPWTVTASKEERESFPDYYISTPRDEINARDWIAYSK